MQGELIPRKIMRTWNQRYGSVDFKLAGQCNAGHRHALKQISDDPLLPATEWLCYRLADALDIPLPPYRIVEMPDSSLAFASELIPGKDVWFAPSTAPRVVDPSRLPTLLALDLFVHNPDRHGGNFVWREVEDGLQLYVIDFSRAQLLELPDLERPLLPSTCKTRITYEKMNGELPFDRSIITATLDHVRSMPDTQMSEWLREIPAPWLDERMKLRLATWWGSGRIDRANWLAHEVRNGHAF